MSKNFAALGKDPCASPFYSARSPTTSNSDPRSVNGVYSELIRRLFRVPSAVAIVGCHSGAIFAAIGDEIAAELAASGKRVLLVPVDKLLRMNPIAVPDEMSFMSGGTGNVWVWPARGVQPIEFFEARSRTETGHWLDYIRRAFDSVLLDCMSVESVQAVADVAAMADATVLCVEAKATTAQQVKSTQYALQLRGAKLAGAILIQRR